MTFRAKFWVGAPLGLLFIGLTAALDVWLINRLINQGIRAQQISFLTFLTSMIVLLSVPWLFFVFYQTISCLTLHYHIDRNGVLVRWAGSEQVIPLRDIQRVVPGRQFGDQVIRRRGVRWRARGALSLLDRRAGAAYS